MAEVTKEQVKSALGVVMAVSETIRELKSVPSGELYAMLMATAGISLQQYEQIIGMLKRTELVKEENHVLRWAGPELPAS